MIKRSDSVRGMGLTYMATDKPTRFKLKAAAAAAGMPLTEYLRYLASSVDGQGRLVNDVPASEATIPAIAYKLDMANRALVSQQTLLNSLCETLSIAYCLPQGRGGDIHEVTDKIEQEVKTWPASMRRVFEEAKTPQGEFEIG